MLWKQENNPSATILPPLNKDWHIAAHDFANIPAAWKPHNLTNNIKPIIDRIPIPIPSIILMNKSLVKKLQIEFQISEKKSVIKKPYNTPS